MAEKKEKRTRSKVVRFFRIDRTPAVKDKTPDVKADGWEEVETASTRADADKLIALLRKADAKPQHYGVTEVIDKGGRQLVS